MKRWQVWTSVLGGILSIGGPGSYLGWRHFSKSSAAAAETVSADVTKSSEPKPPAPIRVPAEEETPQFRPVARASFDARSTPESGSVVPASETSSYAPVQPGTDFYPKNSSTSNHNLTSDDPSTQETADEQPPAKPNSGSSLSYPVPISGQEVRADNAPRELYTGGFGAARGSFNSSEPPPTTEENETSVTDEQQTDVTGPSNGLTVGAEPELASQPSYDQPSASRFSDISGPTPIQSSPTLPAVGRFSNPAPSEPASTGTKQTQPNAGSLSRSDLSTGRGTGFSERIPSPPTRPAAPDEPSGLTAASPGERQLEGAQTPSLSIEKIAPEEIQVGKAARFSIKVRNIGQATAIDVVVTDRVPQGTQLIESAPTAIQGQDGSLRWEIGTLKAGEESLISLDLMPEEEGEIGSVAQVTFHAQAAVRTVATRPLLTIEHSGPSKVLIGEDVNFHITVSNPGSGVATGVVIEVDVPDQLAHEGGREIMSDRFDLRPNETRKLDLVMKAVGPGVVDNLVRAVGDANVAAEHRTSFEVVSPKMDIAVTGPARRYLQRQATYQIALNNPGTAPAHDIELVAYLPQGLRFVSTEKKGQYDQAKHAVYWSLEELPAGETGTVQLSVIPTDTGEQKLHVEGRGALDLTANFDHMTLVEALTELVFTVSDENDPIEVGSETSYEIRITNNGSKPATNVQLAAVLPKEMIAIKADGPTKAEIQGQQIVVEPLSQLQPQQEAIYRIVVQGGKAGDHLIRVQIVSDEFSTPVTKEESTKVYADD